MAPSVVSYLGSIWARIRGTGVPVIANHLPPQLETPSPTTLAEEGRYVREGELPLTYATRPVAIKTWIQTMLTFSGVSACAVAVVVALEEDRRVKIQRSSTEGSTVDPSRSKILTAMLVIWPVLIISYMLVFCVHLMTATGDEQARWHTHAPVPYYLLRTFGMIVLSILIHFTIKGLSTSATPEDLVVWLPLLSCALVIGNSFFLNGRSHNLGPQGYRRTPSFYDMGHLDDGNPRIHNTVRQQIQRDSLFNEIQNPRNSTSPTQANQGNHAAPHNEHDLEREIAVEGCSTLIQTSLDSAASE
ncbi:hypothetical protein FH972_023462 [Carpinus fangiana]|uniref:Uncharacterized protein n=1 Tax=Carpinus fangiana TaxID=176857 RepID=A0A5N6KV91_9ROSI|nr:hypothetical protein FH972_023462 [Carpinus fangiana]